MKFHLTLRGSGTALCCAATLLTACTPRPFTESSGHLPAVEARQTPSSAIPDPVTGSALPPPPTLQEDEQRFTVVVHDVPVRELLFAVARDAQLNVDIAPDVSGNVSLNAIDQTLQAILDRLSQQVSLRYKMQDGTLLISGDTPYFVQYSVPYINLARTSESDISIATQISSTGTQAVQGTQGSSSGDSGGGSSNSATRVKTMGKHQFWDTLLDNVRAILRNRDSMREQGGSAQSSTAQADETGHDNNLIANPEAGVIAVRASAKQHHEVRRFLDNVVEHASRQVLIEATIVEVELNDDYQTGIDWSLLADHGKFSFGQSFGDLVGQAAGAVASTTPPVAIGYAGKEILGSIKMLEHFGNSRVLSSPKLMVLNNQTAVLKVVDNVPYFTTKAELSSGVQGSQPIRAFTTELHTVPVGLVMNVTPQISDNDTVIINVRPTVSRVNGSINDPNPDLDPIKSQIPQIEVREMESILKVDSGDTGIIGGLMQDSLDNATDGLPGISKMGFIDNLFSFKKRVSRKTELVVFLRPRVIKTASTQSDLKDFNQYLENKPVKFEVPEFK